MSKKNFAIIGVIVLAIAGAGFTFINKPQNDSASSQQPAARSDVSPSGEQVAIGLEKGQLAPDFELTTVDGQAVKLSSLRGQPVVISFVLTRGCTPCVIEAENIKNAQKEVSFKAIQIALKPDEPPQSLRDFKDSNGSSDWLIGYDKDEALSKLYKVKAVDTTFMVDAEGKIIYTDPGYPAETANLVSAVKGSAQ